MMIKTGVGNSDTMLTNDICDLASQLNIKEGPHILSLAKKIKDRAGNHVGMQYPNHHMIPNDKYTSQDSHFILYIATSLLYLAQKVIE